jgi:hypothetical protein
MKLRPEDGVPDLIYLCEIAGVMFYRTPQDQIFAGEGINEYCEKSSAFFYQAQEGQVTDERGGLDIRFLLESLANSDVCYDDYLEDNVGHLFPNFIDNKDEWENGIESMWRLESFLGPERTQELMDTIDALYVPLNDRLWQ